MTNKKQVNLHHGNCLDVLKKLPDNSIDSIVTDPPYGLAFMGKKWDYDVPSIDIWKECLRVLKPGGHLLAFAGTRTQHRMAVRIEDAGFEIRDMLAWVYGSGFPKSLDVSKAIDKTKGAEREVTGQKTKARSTSGLSALPTCGGKTIYHTFNETAPNTAAAKKWSGWGTALKPALEPITLARKPLIGTVADNVLTHGTGALNIEGAKVKSNNNEESRWPANFIHDGSQEIDDILGDSARFFYCAKTSVKDREEGLQSFEDKKASGLPMRAAGGERKGEGIDGTKTDRETKRKNNHPTVKPTDLMRYLCKLTTPPGGIILDPFMGSGSTGKAAVLEGFKFTGIELDADYLKIAKARIEHATIKNKKKKVSKNV